MKVPVVNANAYLPDSRLVSYYQQLINNDPEELLDLIDPEFSMLSDTENETDAIDNSDQVNTQTIATKHSNIKQNTENSDKDGQVTDTATSSAIDAIITQHLLKTEAVNGDANQQSNLTLESQQEIDLTFELMQEIIDRDMKEDREEQNKEEAKEIISAQTEIIQEQPNINNNMPTEVTNETKVIEEPKQNGAANTVQKKPRRRKQTLETKVLTSEDLVIEEIDTVPKRLRKCRETRERMMNNEQANVYRPVAVHPQVNTEQHRREMCGRIMCNEEQIENQEIQFVHDGETQQITVQSCAGVSPVILARKTFGRKLNRIREHTQEPENSCSQTVIVIDDD